MSIQFRKHFVTDGIRRVRVHYCLDNRIDGRKCVTLYAKDYADSLSPLFPSDTINESDMQTDYAEKDRVVLFEGHELYKEARAFVESLKAKKG